MDQMKEEIKKNIHGGSKGPGRLNMQLKKEHESQKKLFLQITEMKRNYEQENGTGSLSK